MKGVIAIALASISATPVRSLQTAQGKVSGADSPAPASSSQGIVLDRVVAIVNGDVLLDSDVDEERRFEMIQPYRGRGEISRDAAVQRLIDRTLILQEAEQLPEMEVTNQELDQQLATLRKDIPECKEFHCETDVGWQRYLSDHGFTETEFRARWLKRMELLRYIEMRFRSGVHITDDQIKEYYESTMLPEYARRKVTPPKLETVSQRIQEVLLQQQVSNLLRDWLASLRAQGTVRIVKQDEAAQ
jgi:hypothetical protein